MSGSDTASVLAERATDGDAAGALAQAIADGRWDHAERLLEAPDDSGQQLAELIDRIVRGVERRSKQWTPARKKDSLQRVLDGSRGDALRLQQRLRQLVASWESENAEGAPDGSTGETLPVPLPSGDTAPAPLDELTLRNLPGAGAAASVEWNRIVTSLDGTVQHALPSADGDSRTLAQAIAD